MTWLIDARTVQPDDILGGKGRALAELTAGGFPVPEWVVITPEAFDASLTPTQRSALEAAADASVARQALADIRLASALRRKLEQYLEPLSGRTVSGGPDDTSDRAASTTSDGAASVPPDSAPAGSHPGQAGPEGAAAGADHGQAASDGAPAGAGNVTYAVRSSAAEEDSARHSFAGQLESFLFVPATEVAERIADVWRSGFGKRVYAYRAEHGLTGPPGAPAVLVQRMVHADTSGVAFSADPISGDRNVAVVGSLYGLGTALVDGGADADTHRVDRDGRIGERSIADKTIAHHAARRGGGIVAVPVTPEDAGRPALQDEQVVAVAALARRCEAYLGRPQDIEWAFAGGDLFLLQSRPITSLFDLPEKDGQLNIWDNSNIAESYGGMTTPLTFSFARNAYEGVYRQLCRTFGVSRKRIETNTALFANMLGFIRGRVYYNLLNWYRFLALLPGYKMNRGFMEQMMGVKESLAKGMVEPPGSTGWFARIIDSVQFAGTMIKFGSHYFTLPGRMKKFYARLERALDTKGRDFATLRADELVAEYRMLESQLLSRWDAPLINDFYTMMFYGGLRKLCQRWCGDEAGTLQNDLLCGSGGMVSTEPARRMKEMADTARGDRELVDALCEGDIEAIMTLVEQHGPFRQQYVSYLEIFGERCFDELKLESPTLHDDPLMLFRAVGQFAREWTKQLDPRAAAPGSPGGDAGALPSRSHGVGSTEATEKRVRIQAEARIRDRLGGSRIRRSVFQWVLGNARERVRGRENLRLERTRLFGRVRRIFVELGRRFYERDLLDESRDVFYLDLGEILGFVEGTSTSTELRALANLRKRNFAAYAQMEVPADRFETRGMVYVGNAFQPASRDEAPAGDTRRGIGCCPGRVTGHVRVVRDPRGATLRHGDILVAERTDPSWIMLFPFAAGLVVERGSLLSHSAIVAREMGIPAAVSVSGVMNWLEDGDHVELDGSTGVVTKLLPDRAADATPAPDGTDGDSTAPVHPAGDETLLPTDSAEGDE